MIYLCSIQAFRSEKVEHKVISDEFSYQNPCDLVVKQLFCLPVDIQHFRMDLDQLSQCIFLDIVVETVLQHRLIVIVSLRVPPLFSFHLLEEPVKDFLRLALLLNIRDYEADDIWDDVPVLNLLHFPLPLPSTPLRTVIFIFRRIFSFSVSWSRPGSELQIVSKCCLGEGGLDGIERTWRSLCVRFSNICLCKFKIVDLLSRGREAAQGSEYVVGWALIVVLRSIFLTIGFEGQLSCVNIIYNTYLTSHHLSGGLQIRESKKVKMFPRPYSCPCLDFVCLSANLSRCFYRLLVWGR